MKCSRQCVAGLTCIALSLVIFVNLLAGGDRGNNSREGVARDLTTLALRAQDYYRRGLWEGGGGGSFYGLTMSKLTAKATTPNSMCTIRTVTHTSVELSGTGTQRGNDGQPIMGIMVVFADSRAVIWPN